MALAHSLGKMVAISPHLDDAVFGCGSLLSGGYCTAVVTVFAGIPTEDPRSTPWDRACGFADPQEAVIRRRTEDGNALELLDVRPVWMRFLDRQYGPSAPVEEIAAELRQLLERERPQTVLAPMGLFHSDHELAHEACLQVRAQTGGLRWIAYEDALYRRRRGLLQSRLTQLLSHGIAATPVHLEPGGTGKAQAVQCYASQLRAFGPAAFADVCLPEGFWELEDIA
jgi:LmbE family N-acetylglucosaminyl deacetylase